MLNNEQIGVSAEISIADIFNISISDQYRNRGVQDITNTIKLIIADIFNTNNIPLPIEHVAENQNTVDFILQDNKTLSVKTNKRKKGDFGSAKIPPFPIFSYSIKSHSVLMEYPKNSATCPLPNKQPTFLFFSKNNILCW